MNAEMNRWLKVGAWIGLFIAFLAVGVMVLEHFTSPRFEAGLKAAVTGTLAVKDGGFPVPDEPVPLSRAGDSFERAWTAKTGKKKTGFVFVARVTGNSGPWPAVFVHETGSGTRFAGIAGQPDGLASPARYGLTPRVIETWTGRFEALSLELEAAE